MKKINKILTSLFLVFVLALPIMFVGCDKNGNSTKKLLSVELVSAIKTDYLVGESIDFAGAKLRLVYDDDSRILIDPDSSMVSGFNTATTGNKTMIIEYNGVQRTVAYTVNTFKLGTYHLYYWGEQDSYNAADEEQNASRYMILNADGTGAIIMGGDEDLLAIGWQYTNNKVKVSLVENPESYLLYTVVGTTCLNGTQGNLPETPNPTIFVYRLAE